MSNRQKIAVLVHNDVMRDARVRKQARSLVAAGHHVDVYGFSPTSDEFPKVIENGAFLHICREKKPTAGLRAIARFTRAVTLLKRLKHRARRRVVFSLACLVSIGLNLILLCYVLVPQALSVALQGLAMGAFGALALGLSLAAASRLEIVRDWVRVNWNYQAIAEALADQIIGQGYDVIHCHDIIAMMAGYTIKAREPDIKMVWDAHELYTELAYKTPYISRFTDAMIRKIAPKVDRMITISPSFARIYAQRYPNLPRAEVVMNATRKPMSKERSAQLLRRAAGVRDDQKILLFQGGVSAGRGIRNILLAAPDLPANWTVVFMGQGPLAGDVERAAAKLNTARPAGAPCVTIVPPAPQEVLREWTSGADLGIIPYKNTSLNHLYCMPNKLWEYPNARVPILATDLIEINHIVTGNGTGRLLPRDYTPADIVDAVRGITDVDLRKWRRNCDRFNERENWEKFEPNLLRAYA